MGYKVSGTTIQITRRDSGYFQFTPCGHGSTATMYVKQMYGGTWGNWIALAV